MKIPESDSRSLAEIRSRIISLAESYTPEWKINPDDPDVGMALAEIYSQMYAGTVRRLNKTAEKNRISFCSFLGTRLKASEPSAGHVQFGISSEDSEDEVIVQSGTVLTAEMPDNAQNSFTTVDDVCVTPSRLTHMFLTNGESDLIQNVYCAENDGEIPDFVLFNSKSVNLNKHTAYIGCQNGLFRLIGEGKIIIQFSQKSKEALFIAEEMERAWHNGKLEICYSTENGWEKFSSCTASGDKLKLLKSSSQPLVEKCSIEEVSAYWIRLDLLEINAVSVTNVQEILISSVGDYIVPDTVLTKDGAADDVWFHPFGEIPALLDSFYIASDEALSKSGARVSMQFTVSFPALPELKKVEKPISGWKPIMRKSEIQIEAPEIIKIDSVSWEYFNGIGWKAILCGSELKKSFSPVDGRRTYTLSFICPSDVKPVIVDSEERLFIRARIVKMDQSYKLNTIYHIPLISNVMFWYRCDSFMPSHCVITDNQMRRKYYESGSSLTLFEPMKLLESAWYLGFSSPLPNGPYRILFELEQQFSSLTPELRWEYFSDNSWKMLNCYNDTGQFAHTGCLTIPGKIKLQSAEIFGEKRYWIRVTDIMSAYTPKNRNQLCPHITGMYMNCTEIRNRKEVTPEYFSIPAEKKNFSFRLSEKNVCESVVWINELEVHSRSEINELIHNGNAEPEYDSYGIIHRLWVRWKQVENFFESEANDRHYQIDSNEGIVTFGDGIHGKIPCSGSGDHIRVCYSIGGGSSGNVPTGAVNSSQLALGLVTKILNPMPLYGGNDMEKLSEAMRRTASDFQNSGRCVTARDYEDMILNTERSILKVKCIPGYNADGKYEPGSITILILLSDFSHESSGFYLVQEKLRHEIRSRCSASLSQSKLYIIHPHYIRIYVTIKAVISGSSRMYRVKEQILKRITEFLHPINGNFDGDGWKIGEIPNRQQIENAVRSVRGVAYVESIMMRAFTANEQEQSEIDLNHLTSAAFCIAISGEHNVQVENNM